MIKVLIVLLFFSNTTYANDMGFRFESGFCHKNRHPGYNPYFFGECGNQTGSRLINQSYEDKNFKGSTYNSAYIYQTTFEKVDLSHLSLRRSILMQSTIKNSKARVMDIRAADLKSVTFINTDLMNLLATGTRFVNSKFINCNLSGANFWGANLQGTDFSNSDLSTANLENVYLLFTNFKGAKFNNRTKLPFSEEEALRRGMIKVEDDLPKSTD